MNKINKIFSLIFFVIIFLSLTGQKAAAVNGALSWGYSGGNECWSHNASTTFTVTPEMLDAAGHLMVDYSLLAHNATAALMIDPIWPEGDKGCCWRGDSEPLTGIFAKLPTSSSCYTTSRILESKTDFDLSAAFPTANFAIGTTHTVYCYVFVRTNSTGTGNCSFSVKPSCSLSVFPTEISIGNQATLNWLTTGIFSGTIAIASGSINTIPIESGSVSVTPLISGIYTMMAQGAAAEPKICTAQVTVIPPSCTLTASPNGVFSGETAQLKWQITGAASNANVTIDNGVGSSLASPSGTADTSAITGATTFTLSFTGLDSATHSCSTSIGLTTPPAGGLIPCGRLSNLPPAEDETDLIDESQPCTLCAMFYLLKKIINFITALSAGIGVFILIIAGLLYALSAGNPRNIELAKSAVTSVLIGLAIIFTAWLAIAVILQGMGYAGIGTWYQVSCPLPLPAPPI